MAGKSVLILYFSAHWCPPCRAFTPLFGEAYTKAADPEVEVIFVSFDRKEGDFRSYAASMPWLSMKFGTRQDDLGSMFSVEGIPDAVALDAKTGKIISRGIREHVASGKPLTAAAIKK